MSVWFLMIWMAAGGYLFLCVALYLVQDFFLFHPEKLPGNFVFNYDLPFEEIDIHTPEGARINALHFRAPESQGVVFYFKGNTRSVKGWGKFSYDFVSKGWDFFMIDYPGFGKSTGPRTERTIYEDCQYAYDWLKERYPERRIVVYGRSLGAGFASHTAARNNPIMLILDSPYYSFRELAARYAFLFPLGIILKYQMPLYKDIQMINCPVRIIHGTRDRLIPYKNSPRIVALDPEKVKLHSVTGAHHNNLPERADYHEHLRIFLEEAHELGREEVS